MIGNTVGSSRRTVKAVPGGSRAARIARADSTSSALADMSRPQPKSTETCAVPRVVEERTSCTPGTPRTASSTDARDEQRHLVGRPAAGIEVHDDARKRHLGKQADGQRERRGKSGQGQHQGHHQQRPAVAGNAARRAQGLAGAGAVDAAASLTGSPLCSCVAPVRIKGRPPSSAPLTASLPPCVAKTCTSTRTACPSAI